MAQLSLLKLARERDELRKRTFELEFAKHELTEKLNRIEMVLKYRSEFVANMSHELRTPLNSIIVLSQLLAENRNDNLSDKQIEYAQTIFSSGNLLLQLINEILDIAKMESGKIELSPEKVELDPFLDMVNRMIQPVAQKKGISFGIRIGPGTPPTLFADPLRLQQILNNLLSNAVKFTESGSVTLQVTRAADLPGISLNNSSRDGQIAFIVNDTGIGIPEDKLENIFDPFQQVDHKTSIKYGGTGLGLTISRTLATLMNGEIHVSSKVGTGSVFTLILPERYDPATVQEKAGSHATARLNLKKVLINSESRRPASFYPVRECPCRDDRETIVKGDKVLLIVDDDRSFANILREIGNDKGYKCVVALNGNCALHYASTYRPDAIILDICLPGFNGWEIMDKLKEKEKLRNIPVYIISGANESDEVTDKGAIGFLTKPVNMEKIGQVFQKIADSVSDNGKASSGKQDPSTFESLKGIHVLIVEDNPVNQKIVSKLLDRWGATSDIAENGKEAVDKVGLYHYDLVLMDLQMPELNGYEATQKIREMEGDYGKSLPILALTASAFLEDQSRIYHYGMNGFVIKPFSPQELNRKIGESVRTSISGPNSGSKKPDENFFIQNII